jgi:hypothetical protein
LPHGFESLFIGFGFRFLGRSEVRACRFLRVYFRGLGQSLFLLFVFDGFTLSLFCLLLGFNTGLLRSNGSGYASLLRLLREAPLENQLSCGSGGDFGCSGVLLLFSSSGLGLLLLLFLVLVLFDMRDDNVVGKDKLFMKHNERIKV